MYLLQTNEIRKSYFLKAFNREIENMRIISFGKCNLECPYCKRGGYFRDKRGNIMNAFYVDNIDEIIDDALSKNQRIRLSGGDPVCFPSESLIIAKKVYSKGQKISIAHNGTNSQFVQSLLPYLEYAAIDFKGIGNTFYNHTGKQGNIEELKKILSLPILIDLRICMFKDMSIDEIEYILKFADPKKTFVTLRKYNKVEGCSLQGYSENKILQILEYIKSLGFKCGYRNKWTGCQFIYR